MHLICERFSVFGTLKRLSCRSSLSSVTILLIEVKHFGSCIRRGRSSRVPLYRCKHPVKEIKDPVIRTRIGKCEIIRILITCQIIVIAALACYCSLGRTK
jgi:hypothetical protein